MMLARLWFRYAYSLSWSTLVTAAAVAVSIR